MPKKHFIHCLLFAGIVFAGIASAQTSPKIQEDNDLAEAHLKGKVKYEKSVVYLACLDSGKLKKIDDMSSGIEKIGECFETNYNEMGFKTILIILNTEGRETGREKFSYNKRNELIDDFYYSASGKLVDRTSYRHDSAGHLVAVLKYKSNGEPYVNDSTVYDWIGREIEELSFYDGKLWPVNKYVYDINGNKIEWDDYNRISGTFYPTLKFKFDDKGNEIEQDCSEQNSRITMEHDERGNKTKQTEFLDRSLLTMDSCWYDAQNNLAERIVYSQDSNEVEFKEFFAYDKEGNETLNKRVYGPKQAKVVISNGGSSEYIEKTTYEYDNFGNWTKQVAHVDGQKKYIVRERVLTYY